MGNLWSPAWSRTTLDGRGVSAPDSAPDERPHHEDLAGKRANAYSGCRLRRDQGFSWSLIVWSWSEQACRQLRDRSSSCGIQLVPHFSLR